MAIDWTAHARERQHERGIPDDHIAAALSGRMARNDLADVEYWLDPATRVTVVVKDGAAVTVLIAKPRQIKRQFGMCSRGWE